MSVIEQYARAHIVTDLLDEDRGAVPVVLRYDPEHDPRCVRVRLPGAGAREWTVERELLERGLRTPAGSGAVRVWPCGRVQTVLEFHSAQGVSVVQFDTKALVRFLRRTYAVAAQPVAH
ncbi:SsgA family sporulation/cell division regulator [Streptomyces sp. Tu 3180]|uniref:SsgA family sporulation/cell division regulator n=1 Tax=Streptomyces sp. Tu 3180 TaxID=2682611 RepID=UPI0013585701|nr:SsgA family sporulation/cell division regulator [Streptomyces sp. Tu 3180]KAF3465880.1 SsgA family sporulation/cell division regulator [Streptomyces sp. Tu 3180]